MSRQFDIPVQNIPKLSPHTLSPTITSICSIPAEVFKFLELDSSANLCKILRALFSRGHNTGLLSEEDRVRLCNGSLYHYCITSVRANRLSIFHRFDYFNFLRKVVKYKNCFHWYFLVTSVQETGNTWMWMLSIANFVQFWDSVTTCNLPKGSR